MYREDTIAAICTPLGEGGIGIIRISGPDAEAVLTPLLPGKNSGGLESHRFYYRTLSDPRDGQPVDEVMVVVMRAPRSYTREDVVEIQCHGGTLVTERILDLVLSRGARLAEPGEFTKRAFLNGRIDLLQAEAVIDIIRSRTDAALAVAQGQRQGALSREMDSVRDRLVDALAILEAFIDFPEEDIDAAAADLIAAKIASAREDVARLLSGYEEGRALRDGVSVLIAGKPNVGKSSLLNILVQEKRAIVTAVPGTTRDVIEEVVNFGGLPVRLMDTAGIRETEDIVEQEGVRRTLEKIPEADLVLFVVDNSRALDADDETILAALADKEYLLVVNKSDLEASLTIPAGVKPSRIVSISAAQGDGVDHLRERIVSGFRHGTSRDGREGVLISRVRHRDALERSFRVLDRVAADSPSLPPELLAVDLREALAAVGEVTGHASTDDLLDRIFSQFCIGK